MPEFVDKTKEFKERKFVEKFIIPVDQYKTEAANWNKLLQPYYKTP